jgi:hypothetical protein
MTKPNFFIVGAQKAGSTSLYHILSKQKDVFIPSKKELRFFSFHYPKGFDWYCNTYFKNTADYKLIGEADPSYLADENAPSRIAKHCGRDIKIVMILRQPVKRAYSQYIMNKKLNPEKFSEWVALPFESQLIKESNDLIDSNYLQNGCYYKAINNYLKSFNLENIHIILFDDFITDKQNTLNKLSKFLEIDEIQIPQDTHKNKSSVTRMSWMKVLYSDKKVIKKLRNLILDTRFNEVIKKIFTKEAPKISEDQIKKLTHLYFKDDIEKLEELLKLDLNNWK